MSTTKVCSIDCAIEEATNVRLKKEAKDLKQNRQKLKELKESKLSYWIPKAQFWFNKYIRMRDVNNPCISCNGWHTGQYHAGHYRSVGSAPHLRFNELNCHRQCSVCNNHLSGNLIKYRVGLVEKIGTEKVEQLENDNTAKHYTIDDVKKLEAYYKAKCKELENA
jgi:hypothetical protein